MGFGPILGSIAGVTSVFDSIFGYNNARDQNQSNINENAKSMQFSAEQAQKSMDFSSNEAEKARSFDERMSSTAFQRATDDMKAAGLNPMLAAGNASSSPSSPSPSGSPVTGSAAQIQRVPSFMSGISSSARDVVGMLQDVQESNSRIGLNTRLGDKALADAGLSRTTADKIGYEAYVERMKKQFLEKFMHSGKSFVDYTGQKFKDFRNGGLPYEKSFDPRTVDLQY